MSFHARVFRPQNIAIMKRRDTLKTIIAGTIGGVALGTGAASCQNDAALPVEDTPATGLYGRTPEELARDKRIMAEEFLNAHEMATITVLCDIILPATATAGAASAAKVPEFIEFIVKDIPSHKLPVRGGLMWLDGETVKRFDKVFVEATPSQRLEIIEDIAWPDKENKKPELAPGIAFFNYMRNLTLTGYYTTQMGIEDLGYTGNFANTWDGVPAEVLAKHDVDYDPEWLAKCVDQSKRMDIAEWDEDGNLLT